MWVPTGAFCREYRDCQLILHPFENLMEQQGTLWGVEDGDWKGHVGLAPEDFNLGTVSALA